MTSKAVRRAKTGTENLMETCRLRAVHSSRLARQMGYAYLALMISRAINGVAAAAAAQVGAVYQRRMAEKALLFIGGEFQRALVSYAQATPPMQAPQPRTAAPVSSAAAGSSSGRRS